MNPYRHVLALGLLVTLIGCGSGDAGNPPAGKATNEPTTTGTPKDIASVPDAPLESGTYFIDPDDDPSTSLRVQYTISADSWEPWIGASKSAGDGHVGVSIAIVTNVPRHGCRDHSPADPLVGPTVDDLAAALADLAPFRVTSPPRDITIYGYRGKHLELTVPKIDFAECRGGNLHSWIAPPYGAFYGYTGPGYVEEFWILDVEGSRLMIAAEQSPDSPAKDVAEMRAILDSIRIEP